MKKLSGLVFLPSAAFAAAFAVASASAAAAQSAYVAAAGGGSAYTQSSPAPIERMDGVQAGYAPQNGAYGPPPNSARPGEGTSGQQPPSVVAMHPAQGITVRADQATEVKTVASDAQHTEIRLERGVANVAVHDPAPDMLILVDLPAGQTQLLKNGFYTFNAGTNTARVFSGEADAFTASNKKPQHVKGGDQAVFAAGSVRVSYSDPYYSRADVLAGSADSVANGMNDRGGDGYAPGYGAPAYAYGGEYYGGYDGFYGDGPYYAYGYPYVFGYGYPYFGYGLGFGYGFGGYGYRGYGYGGYGYGGGYGYRGGVGGRGYPGGGTLHPGGIGGAAAHFMAVDQRARARIRPAAVVTAKAYLRMFPWKIQQTFLLQ